MVELYKDKIWLEKQYLGSHKSSCAVARLCSCSYTTVLRWLEKFSIPIRDAVESISIANKGNIPWNKGLTKEMDMRVANSEATRQKMMGRKSWCKGLTKETDERLRKKGEKLKGHPGHMKGVAPWNKGLTKETDARLEKRSLSYKGRFAGEKHPNWKGGKSFEPYAIEFNNQLKELIRQRDNYQCQRCGCSERENMRKLAVHHIDYDKKNCLPSNLFSLCCGCNSLVNENRGYWEQCFKEKMKLLYGADYVIRQG